MYLTFSGTKLETRQKLGKLSVIRASLVSQMAKNMPAVRSWSCEDYCLVSGQVARDSDLTAYKSDSPCGRLLQMVGWFPGLVATDSVSEFSFYTWSGYCMFL